MKDMEYYKYLQKITMVLAIVIAGSVAAMAQSRPVGKLSKNIATSILYNSTLATLSVEFYRNRNEHIRVILPPGTRKRINIPAGRSRFVVYTYHRPPKVFEKDVSFPYGSVTNVTLKDSLFGSRTFSEAPRLPTEARNAAITGITTNQSKIANQSKSPNPRPNPFLKASWFNASCAHYYKQYKANNLGEGAVFVVGYNARANRFVCVAVRYSPIDKAEQGALKECRRLASDNPGSCKTLAKNR